MASMTADQEPAPRTKPSYWIGLSIAYLLIPLILWVCGWDLSWWQAWVYSFIIVVAGIAMRILAGQRHPGLLADRAKFEKARGVKSWDKILSSLMAISVGYPLFFVAGLDHRFHWSPAFPLWLNILGLILCMFGYTIAGWSIVENRYFTSTVRIQTDRGHVLCDTGPYRIVRHPGYAGNLPPLIGIALSLSSLWALIPAAVALIIALLRTELEDRTLQEELPGYRDYAQRVRYRLIPWIY